jgi:hypothetical protein
MTHFAFIVFVLFGGLLALRWRRAPWIHLPAAIWGAVVEFANWSCPLTPLENWLRRESGVAGYEGGYIDHYLMPIIYPAGLTSDMQVWLGVVVVVVNGAIYLAVALRRKRA